MARVTYLQTNFTAGELSPRMYGRGDVSRYASGVKSMFNCYPVVQGGAIRRPCTRYMGEVEDSANITRLIPFVYSEEISYVLEFGDQVMRVWTVDGQVEVTGTPYQITTPYTSAQLADLDFTQNGATMVLFHPDVAPYRLDRFADDSWTIGAISFVRQPFDEVGFAAATTGTLSLATVGTGRTLTAGAATFLAADVGRRVQAGAGMATITGYTSTTVVTVSITQAFASTSLTSGNWSVLDTPMATCTPSAKDPVGATITLTLSAAGWRSADVGKLVRINSGLCLISAYTSTTVVSATILTVLSSTAAAIADSWSLNGNAWSATRGYPRTGTFYEQRLICASTEADPMAVWGSRSGIPFDFTIGTADDDAFKFTLSSDQMSPIQYVSAMRALLALTYGGEYTIQGGIEKPVTPTNVQVRQRTNHGTALIRPVRIGREELFVQRGGVKVMALSYSVSNDDYVSENLTTLANHITESGVVDMCWQQDPDRLLWVALGDGTLATLTLERNQEVIGWARHELDGGVVESLASIPGASEDVVFAVVARTINGAAVRYVEKFDPALFVDCAITGTSGPGAATWTGLDHLEGETVRVNADGVDYGPATVTGGEVVLTRTANTVQIGLAVAGEIELLDPEMQTGFGQTSGNNMRTSEVTIRLLETSQCKVNGQELPFRKFGSELLDQAMPSFTGVKRVENLGWDKGSSELTVTYQAPMAWHVLSITRKLTVND